MSKPKPPRGYAFDDDANCNSYSPRLGVVRCPDGDLDAWAKCSAQVLDDCGYGRDEVELKPPVWGWFRWNPDPSRSYPCVLAQQNRPGRGTWRGALVIAKEPTS